MKLTKRIVTNKLVQSFICWFMHLYIRFVHLTTKWDISGAEHLENLARSGKPFIIAFWHGRLLMIPPFSPNFVSVNVLISNHNDGELIAKVMSHFKINVIRGSSKKDGLTAFRQIIKTLKNNDVVVITPDGPRGPRMRVTGAIIDIAHKMSVPILPMTYSVSNSNILKSWDRFMIAKPFGKGRLIYSPPMLIDKGCDVEAIKNAGVELENTLNTITNQADEAVGVVPVQPDNSRDL